MKRRPIETGDIVRFRLKYVRKGQAPKGRYEVMALGALSDGEPVAELRRMRGPHDERNTRNVRTDPVAHLALDVEVGERLARKLME